MKPMTSQVERRRLDSCWAKRFAVLGHGAGLFIERSTVGTARSVSSVICHSSAGVALARPATSIVGKVAWRVLYSVATSL